MAYHPDGSREQIHVAGPSLLPFFTAIGITVAVVGLIFSWWFVLAGGIVFLLAVVRWIRTAKAEYDSLPLDVRER